MNEDGFPAPGTEVPDVPPRSASHGDIVATNPGRRDAADEEAFELEPGPNNCATSRDALRGA